MQDLKEFFTDLKSFNCDGRLSREQYWKYSIIGFIMLTIIVFVLNIPGQNSGSVPAMISTAYAILFFPFNVRRLHDLNRNGIWLLFSIMPIFNIILELYMILSKGTVGPNKYGPDPLEKY